MSSSHRTSGPYKPRDTIVPRPGDDGVFLWTNSPGFTRRRRQRRGSLPRTAVLLVAAAALAGLSHAQVARQPDILQLAAAGIPGVGLQIGYVDAGSAFTREAVAYVNLSPRFASNRETLHVSAGVGGAIRILGTLETLTLIAPRAWDIHLGFRFGPGLRFAADETRSAKNQRFSLFLEPFVRFATVLRGTQTYFLEAGIQKPVLRLGVWFGI